jgi:hypothetical protein
VRRAEKLGVIVALDDSPRRGRERDITEEARTFVVDLACRKPKELGYPHELWTTRLLTRHIREHGPTAAYRDALKERTRERVPFEWAMTQNDLGLTLCRLASQWDFVTTSKR